MSGWVCICIYAELSSLYAEMCSLYAEILPIYAGYLPVNVLANIRVKTCLLVVLQGYTHLHTYKEKYIETC